MKKLLVILGPTATGKTDLALNIAKKLNGELVSCDSRQVYKNLDIGTGKLPSKNVKYKKYNGYWIIDNIKVWLYDLCNPNLQYNVADFILDAENVVKNISPKLPILVGGTGLYIKALVEGFEKLNYPADLVLRKTYEDYDLEKLQLHFKSQFPVIWESLNNSEKNNKRRLIRKLEILNIQPDTNKEYFLGLKNSYEILKIGLKTNRQKLNQRIDLRVEKRVKQGMVEEAEKLSKFGLNFSRMRELGLEYKYLADFLEGKLSQDEFQNILKIKIHQYAKRQMTWFKKEEDIVWFDVEEKGYIQKVEKLVIDWYN